MHLSVAAPPHRREDALCIVAEHFVFCPDNVWQGTHHDLTPQLLGLLVALTGQTSRAARPPAGAS
ncbi:DUF4253 domain-containing protein [Streptomyces flaveolus]|uniref:DUF4253 domain-containing protein n=1 Tax=Streptomyces flaveolus TaxID=67297 RepID=UPI0036F5EC4E